MTTTNTCHPVTLASGPLGQIQRCAHCNCVSVHLGAITVRVDELGLQALAALFGEATAQLVAARPRLSQHLS
ncbi:MAG: hypothetical protein QM817_19980 [Archangium sp.]